MSEFVIKDSGERAHFSGGMQRDTTTGKPNFLNVRFGPLLRRWAAHTTKGRDKYPDPQPGVPNWTLAEGIDEYLRFKESAARHFEQWLAGDRDEDHAAAVIFNMNGAEYVLEKDPGIDPAAGAAPPERKPMTVECLKPVYEHGFPACTSKNPAYPTWHCDREVDHSGEHWISEWNDLPADMPRTW